MSARRGIALFDCFVVGVPSAVALAVILYLALGFRDNTTESMPTGLWQEKMRQNPLVRGEIVSVCPPDTELFRRARERGYLESGSCPAQGGGFAPLIKPVAAVAGDVVVVSAEGIAVNGQALQQSRPQFKDSFGRELPQLPQGVYRVGPGEIWVVSTCNLKSFDSRYYGALSETQVRGELAPVWVRPVTAGEGQAVSPGTAHGLDCLKAASQDATPADSDGRNRTTVETYAVNHASANSRKANGDTSRKSIEEQNQ